MAQTTNGIMLRIPARQLCDRNFDQVMRNRPVVKLQHGLSKHIPFIFGKQRDPYVVVYATGSKSELYVNQTEHISEVQDEYLQSNADYHICAVPKANVSTGCTPYGRVPWGSKQVEVRQQCKPDRNCPGSKLGSREIELAAAPAD